MNFILIHEIYTIILFILFLVIVGWTWSGKRQTVFYEASRLPFLDDPVETTLTTSTDKENYHE